MTKTMALELGPKNVRTNIVCPAHTMTPMTERFLKRTKDSENTYQRIVKSYPLNRIVSTRDIANVALFLASDEATFLNGIAIVVDGGYTAEPLGFNFWR